MTKNSCPKYEKSKNVLEILVSKPVRQAVEISPRDWTVQYSFTIRAGETWGEGKVPDYILESLA